MSMSEDNLELFGASLFAGILIGAELLAVLLLFIVIFARARVPDGPSGLSNGACESRSAESTMRQNPPRDE